MHYPTNNPFYLHAARTYELVLKLSENIYEQAVILIKLS